MSATSTFAPSAGMKIQSLAFRNRAHHALGVDRDRALAVCRITLVGAHGAFECAHDFSGRHRLIFVRAVHLMLEAKQGGADRLGRRRECTGFDMSKIANHHVQGVRICDSSVLSIHPDVQRMNRPERRRHRRIDVRVDKGNFRHDVAVIARVHRAGLHLALVPCGTSQIRRLHEGFVGGCARAFNSDGNLQAAIIFDGQIVLTGNLQGS